MAELHLGVVSTASLLLIASLLSTTALVLRSMCCPERGTSLTIQSADACVSIERSGSKSERRVKAASVGSLLPALSTKFKAIAGFLVLASVVATIAILALNFTHRPLPEKIHDQATTTGNAADADQHQQPTSPDKLPVAAIAYIVAAVVLVSIILAIIFYCNRERIRNCLANRHASTADDPVNPFDKLIEEQDQLYGGNHYNPFTLLLKEQRAKDNGSRREKSMDEKFKEIETFDVLNTDEDE